MSETNLNLISKACEEIFKENGLNSIDVDSSGVGFDKSNITATIGLAGDVQGHGRNHLSQR
jgi:hypothetical protein